MKRTLSRREALDEAHAQARFGKIGEAYKIYETILQRHPDDAEAMFHLAAIEAKRGKLERARDLLERTAQLSPKDVGTWYTLGQVRARLRDKDGAIAAFARAIKVAPGFAPAQAEYGSALARAGRYENARAVLEHYLKKNPGDPVVSHNLGNVLMNLKDHQGAAAAFRDALTKKPDDPIAQYSLGRALIWTGEFHESIELLSSAIEKRPAHLQMISYKILALRHAGFTEAADELEGLDDLILEVELACPKEFASLEDFNAALAEEIQNHPALTDAFENRATRNGAKVDYMFGANRTPLFDIFQREVKTAFEATVKRMPRLQGHPLPLDIEGDYTMEMWANVMRKGGHQRPHNHPKGWFSACYYNVVPDAVDTSGDANEGWIEFGGTAYDFPAAPMMPTRRIKPVPGKMVVFPSYVFHRTIPYESDETRISCAFDAKPHIWGR